MSTSIRSVVVIGGSVSAWLAASAIKKAFAHVGIDVLVVEPSRGQSALPGLWTIPSLRGFHSRIGIREGDLLKRTGATYRLGSEHLHWQNRNSRYLHVHGDIGTPLNGTPFYKYLLMRELAGHRENVDRYSLAATAASMGRFARPMSTNALTSSFAYGYHLDTAAYTHLLREHAIRLGVTVEPGDVVEIERPPSGRIEHVICEDRRIAGDLFIDCSGALISRMSDERDDWSGWLINDRIVAARAPASSDPPALTRTVAGSDGWSWQLPLADSTIVGHAFSSRFTEEAAARQHLRTATGCDEPIVIRLSQGRRRTMWDSNCIAIGDAGVELEPLAGTALHLAELGVALLIELFPLEADSRLEAIEYNRLMGEHADALRDFTLAHYRAESARTEPYWQATRAAAPPERFARRMELYRAGGRLQMLDNESFEETDWAWILLGTRCLPESLEMHLQAYLESVPSHAFDALQTTIQRLAAAMPSHIEYVRHQLAARPRE